jgi:dienelactone hydrolase
MPRPKPTRRLVLGALAGSWLAAAPGGCTTWPAPTVPMPVRRIAARCAVRQRCVLLPGVYSRADDFVGNGFVADLQRAAPACELLLADAHLGYFVEGQLVRRLREDVVRPAQAMAGAGAAAASSSIAGAAAAAPANRPWLAGISLGGLAALAYAMRHGDEVAGVLAIAPYLGRRTLLRDISAAGGPLAWSRSAARPGPDDRDPEALEDALWHWLAQRGAAPGAAALPPLYLGYGRADRFADAQQVLQTLLPAGHTDVVDGGHDWPPWRALWQRWLQRGLLAAPAADCGGTA